MGRPGTCIPDKTVCRVCIVDNVQIMYCVALFLVCNMNVFCSDHRQMLTEIKMADISSIMSNVDIPCTICKVTKATKPLHREHC
jgi:hypothetical protein